MTPLPTFNARRLPSPCCTWCGHTPHADGCDDCPCVIRVPQEEA